MRRTIECSPKARLSFSGGPHTPVNMADCMEEVNVDGEKNAGNGVFAALYCARFRTPSFHKSLKFFGTSIASLDPETVELPAFNILSAMFTGACGPPKKLSLTLVSRSNILGLIVKFAYTALAKLTYVLSVIQSKLCLRHLLYHRLMKGWSFLFSIDVSPALHCSL